MSGTQNVNSWLFNQDPFRTPTKKPADHLAAVKRNLLNEHLDGELTKSELQEKLLELRANGQD